jgi:VanZ family protein
MVEFVSRRERRLWFWTLAVVVAIYSTLGLTQTLAGVLRDRDMLDATFFFVFLVLEASIVVIALRSRPGITEVGVVVGVIAVYLLAFSRMASPEERTHLFEYGLLAILILEALRERSIHVHLISDPSLLAIGAAGTLGVVDEVIQWFIPNRVFDPIDIGFNTLAAVMAVATSLALGWAKRRKSDRSLRRRLNNGQ